MENIKVPQTTLVYPLSGSIVIRIIRNREVLLFCKSGKHVQDLNTPLTRLQKLLYTVYRSLKALLNESTFAKNVEGNIVILLCSESRAVRGAKVRKFSIIISVFDLISKIFCGEEHFYCVPHVIWGANRFSIINVFNVHKIFMAHMASWLQSWRWTLHCSIVFAQHFSINSFFVDSSN